MAQYSYPFGANQDDEVPDGSSFYVPNGPVSVVISNVRSSVTNWSLGLILLNPNTGNATPPHAVTSSNPSTVFTDMLAGNYRLLLRSASGWVNGTATIYTS